MPQAAQSDAQAPSTDLRGATIASNGTDTRSSPENHVGAIAVRLGAKLLSHGEPAVCKATHFKIHLFGDKSVISFTPLVFQSKEIVRLCMDHCGSKFSNAILDEQLQHSLDGKNENPAIQWPTVKDFDTPIVIQPVFGSHGRDRNWHMAELIDQSLVMPHAWEVVTIAALALAKTQGVRALDPFNGNWVRVKEGALLFNQNKIQIEFIQNCDRAGDRITCAGKKPVWS